MGRRRKALLTEFDVAGRLNISVRELRHMRHSGVIPHVCLGRGIIRFERRAIEEYVAAKTVPKRSAVATKRSSPEVTDMPSRLNQAVTLRDLCDRDMEYLRIHGRSQRTIQSNRHILGHLERILGNMDADAIGPAEVERFVAERSRTLCPRSLNKDVRVLRAVWNRAIRLELVKHNPWQGFEWLKEDPVDSQPISKEEEQALLKTVAGDIELKVWTRLLFESGCRPGEICALRWLDIDLDVGEIHIQCRHDWRPKTRRNRTAYCTPETVSLLRRWHRRHANGQRLFGPDERDPVVVGNRLRRRFKKAAAQMNRTIKPYDIRRTFGSRLAPLVDPKLHAELLGHTNPATSQKYYRAVTEDEKREAMRRLWATSRPQQ